jgi:signal transduction histidine kinase
MSDIQRSGCFARLLHGKAGALILAALALSVFARAQDSKSVLVLHTYNGNMTANRLWSEAFRETLGQSIHNQLFEEYFDKDRLPEQDEALRKRLRDKYRATKLDLVVSLGRIPLQFVIRHGEELWPAVPKICAAGDPRVLKGVKLPAGMACVFGHMDFGLTLALALQLMPDTQRVFYVGGSDPAEETWRGLASEEFRRFAGRVEITFIHDLPLSELLNQLGHLPEHSVVIYTGIFRDGTGQAYVPDRVCPAVVSASNAPVFGTLATYVGCGVVGGVVMDGKALSAATANLAIRVLERGTTDGIPIEELSANQTVLDWRQLRHWNVAESRLPIGAVVRYREPTVWERFRFHILGALALVLVQFGLIVALMFQRRQRAEAVAVARQLNGRLINAGEEERKRIARELHDDIGQRLSLVSVELDMERGTLSKNNENCPVNCLSEPLQQLGEIITDVHNLSHQLHSTKLQVLGLAVALRDLCRQLSEKHRVAIQLAGGGVPCTLQEDVALCFYRVAQEALNNSIKYSGSAHIEVKLIFRNSNLTMKIRDFGSGFDPASQVGGLGLATMQERLRNVGGRLLVSSRPGAGTELTAHARCASLQMKEAAALSKV